MAGLPPVGAELQGHFPPRLRTPLAPSGTRFAVFRAVLSFSLPVTLFIIASPLSPVKRAKAADGTPPAAFLFYCLLPSCGALPSPPSGGKPGAPAGAATASYIPMNDVLT